MAEHDSMAANTESSLKSDDTPVQTSDSSGELDTATANAAAQCLLARVEEDYMARQVEGISNKVQTIHCLELRGAIAALDSKTEGDAIGHWLEALALRNEPSDPVPDNGKVPLFQKFRRPEDVEQLRGDSYNLAIESENVFKRLLDDDHPAAHIAMLHVIEHCAFKSQHWEKATQHLRDFIHLFLASDLEQSSRVQTFSLKTLHTAVPVALRICCMAKTFLDGHIDKNNNEFCVKLTLLLFFVLVTSVNDVKKYLQKKPSDSSQNESNSETLQFNEKRQIIYSSQSELVRAVHKSLPIGDPDHQQPQLTWCYQCAIKAVCHLGHPAFDTYRGAGIWRHWLNGELTLAGLFIDCSDKIGTLSACGNQPVHLSSDGQKRTLMHGILSEDALSKLDRGEVLSVIEKLHQNGAKLDSPDNSGRTVLDLLTANNFDLSRILPANSTGVVDD